MERRGQARESVHIQRSHSMIVLIGQQGLVELGLGELGGGAVNESGCSRVQEGNDVGFNADDRSVFLVKLFDGQG